MHRQNFILASIFPTVNEPGGLAAKLSRLAFSLTRFNLDEVQFITSPQPPLRFCRIPRSLADHNRNIMGFRTTAIDSITTPPAFLKDRDFRTMGKKASVVEIDFRSWMERLKASDFTTVDRGGDCVFIVKYGCGALLEKKPAGEPHFAVRPGLLMGGGVAHLFDRGFQKFWQSAERTLPATAAQLKSLHSFEEDLRAIMGLTAFYNQSLGTVSSRYVYDRVEGREGPRVHRSFD
jgi:hypothetical protein